jgi:hypothetical protein
MSQNGAALGGGMHTVSQFPQCELSLIVLTHEPLQLVSVPQSPVHSPPLHTRLVLHASPQALQCAWSEFRSTQSPEQSV